MRGTLHHLDLTVSDPIASRPFYDLVLGHLGYRCERQDQRGFDWYLRDGAQDICSIGIVRAEGDGKTHRHDRYSPGLHHVAWRADSRKDVDELHQRLRAFGATILDPPAEYPQYRPGYYAVFFADPDGLKLEFVYTP
jgi:glyoxylase I family protein